MIQFLIATQSPWEMSSLSHPAIREAGDGPGSVGHDTAVQNSRNAKGKNLKRCSIINMKRKKGSKKVQPNGNNENSVTHLNNKPLEKSQSCTNLSTLTQDQPSPRAQKTSLPTPTWPPTCPRGW